MSRYDDDLNNKSDEEVKQETYKILEEDVFSEAEKKINNFEYTDYSDYNKYNDKKIEKKKNKNPFIIFIIIVAVIIIVRCLFMSFTLMDVDYDDYDDYESEETYDIEYDIDRDGYLNYNEREQYNSDKEINYEELITFKEVFVDEYKKTIYFEYENRNEFSVSSIELDIIYYDKDGKIIDIGKTYLNGNVLNRKVYGDIEYSREFESYEYKFIVDLYGVSYYEAQYPDVEVLDYDKEIVNSSMDITLKNYSEKDVSGSIYIVFYNGNEDDKEIVYVVRDSIFELKPGKKLVETVFLNKNIIPSYENIEINLDSLEVEEY